MLYFVKILIAAIVIVAVTEVSKGSTLLGALIKSLPIISIVSLTWLYLETEDLKLVGALSTATFWLVLPTLPMFLALPWLLSRGFGFFPALLMVVLLTGGLYAFALRLYSKLGINL